MRDDYIFLQDLQKKIAQFVPVIITSATELTEGEKKVFL